MRLPASIRGHPCSSFFPDQQTAGDGAIRRRHVNIGIIQGVVINDDAVEYPVLVGDHEALAIHRYGADEFFGHLGRGVDAPEGPAFLAFEMENELRCVPTKRVVPRDKLGPALLVPGWPVHDMSPLG